MARADDTELIDRFEEFYRDYYRNDIGELAQQYPTEEKSLYVDWGDLYRFDPDLADDLRTKPGQLIEYAEEALRVYDLPVDVSLGQAHVRVENLPETTDIRDIRADHRGSLVAVQGIVRKATDVRPKITDAAFECQRCGTLSRIPQTDGDFQEPHECQGCERQGPFRINFDQSEFVDAQKLRIQESPEGLRGGETPQSIDVNIEDDITGEVTAGDHVEVTGTLKLDQQGSEREKSPMFDVYMDGLAVSIEDEQFEEMAITDEDKKEIVELSNHPGLYEQMQGAIAPSIYGYETQKLAMVLQLFSGVTKHLPDESRIRGDLHMLLIGDPGTGKCLSGDTKVTLGNGRREAIRSVVETHLEDPKPVDDGVYDTVDIPLPSVTESGQAVQRRATKVWKREAPDRMYRIETASGRTLEVTPSHPLFVQSGGRLTPRKAEKLQQGAFIATPERVETSSDVTLDVDYRQSRSHNAVRLELPEVWTPWLARLVGYIVAEGYATLREDNTGSVVITNEDREILDDVAQAYERLGLPYTERDSNSETRAQSIACTASEFVSFLSNLDPAILKGSAHQRVPTAIETADERTQHAFLRAYIDSEGHVSSSQREIAVASMSRQLLDDVRSLLLSSGIHSRLEPRHNGSYRLRISGTDFDTYVRTIGFVTDRKAGAATAFDDVPTNTNTDVVPDIGDTLRRIREALALSQFECGISRTSYQHYERGDRNPSRNSLSAVIGAFEDRLEWLKEQRKRLTDGDWQEVEMVRDELGISQQRLAEGMDVTQTAISYYERNGVSPDGGHTADAADLLVDRIDEALSVEQTIEDIRTLVESDVRWDRIESIEAIEPDYDWVYDLEVAGTHTYLSNGIVSHNSKLLQYIRQIAPRSVYTSGKGSSAAGLCVAGDTLLATDEGFRPIREVVSEEIPDSVTAETSVDKSVGVQTFDREMGKMGHTTSTHAWRMPEKPCRRIETNHGKELEASVNTPVLTCGEDGIEWRDISEIEPGNHVAVPRGDGGIDRSELRVRRFLELTTEKIQLSETSVSLLRESLSAEFGTLRDAAAALDLSEDFVYLHLKNRHVPVEKLDRILKALGMTRDALDFDRVMVRHGDSITLPETFDEDLTYLLGLVFGDGDIRLDRRGENRGMVRISNGDESLLERAARIFDEKFDKQPDIEYQDDRVPCIRVYNTTIARLFANAGMQTPKDGLALAPAFTTAEHADAFLRGLMDADGSVSVRETGGSSVLLSTISDELAQQVQLMLETYGVRASVRERDRRGTYELDDGRTIESKHVQQFVEICGADIDRYADAIGFESEEKQHALERIVSEERKQREKLPVGAALTTVEGTAGTYYQNIHRGDNPGRERAGTMVEDIDLGPVESTVSEAVEASLRWDEVVETADTGHKEVFDLTVPETHNFVANGIVTHNTAAAVRDDFGDSQQWTLEAGALVLADQGIAAVDELDKMRCVTGDTLVQTADGITPIRELALRAEGTCDVEFHPNGRTIRGVDHAVWTMAEDGRLTTREITAVHEYGAPEELRRVTLESGETVTATADHPFFVLSEGHRIERKADELKRGDWVYVPKSLPQPSTDGGVATTSGSDIDSRGDVTPAHGAVLGYIAGDGNVYYNRESGSYGIRFTNREEELLSDFERACREAFDATPVRPPSEQRADGVETVRVHGREHVDELLEIGLNLEAYDGKRVPAGVARGADEVKTGFLRALADSEGCVDDRKVKICSSSYELLLGAKLLLAEFGVTSQIQVRNRDQGRDLYLLVITAAGSLEAFRRHVGFTLSRKQDALATVCGRASGDRTILDVVPDCGDLFARVREGLRLYQSECGLADATYCDFENGDANFSLSKAERVLERFEQRHEQARCDAQTLADACPWETLATLKERYHVSQRELASGTEYSQQQISRHWGADPALRTAVRRRLREILDRVAEVDFDHLSSLIRGDVKWRRVTDVTAVDPSVHDGRVPVLRHRLADLLGGDESDAVTDATTLLDTEPIAQTWPTLREELDRHGIPLQRIADRMRVANSTVSRWFNGVVDGESFETVRTVAMGLIEAKRERVRSLLSELRERQEPKVYDLTVEGTHNFLANGMVVHNSEDRSAMHEALEQQSYHPDTEILLADGRRVDIGTFVDERMAENPTQVTDGVDCEILPVDDVGVHSVDMEANDVEKTTLDRVSRHEAPDEFVRVEFSNGRDVLVTPEHPMFVDVGEGIETVEARQVEPESFVPAPRKLPNTAVPVELDEEPHVGKEKDVTLPEEVTPALGEILGFLVAEGHSYAGSAHEIGFSNQDPRLLDRMDRLMTAEFGMESTDTTNGAGTVTKRWVSTKLYRWFETNFPAVMHTAREKRIPSAVLGASEEVIRRFLVGAFAGDGGVESEAMSFATASEGLARDYADALSKIGVASRIHYDKTEDSWKTYVMGDSTERFVEQVVEADDTRHETAKRFVERSVDTPRHHDVLPTSAAREIRALRRLLGLRLTGKYRPHLDEGYGVQRETVRADLEVLRDRVETIRASLASAEDIAAVRNAVGWSGRQLADRLDGVTASTVQYAETGGYDETRRRALARRAREAAREALSDAEDRIEALESRCDLRYYRVTDVEVVPNEGEYDCEWVYDVTVEPTNTFVSEGVVLHNSISVSKAGINATLKSRCSLLGAANPKYGRFDQYEPIAEQIDLEPALISRFDLIFTVTDEPDEEEDANLAEHILTTNYAGELHTHRTETSTSNYTEEEVQTVTDEVAPTVEPELLRKYIAYAKRNCFPTMTEQARAEIRDFYVDLRSRGAEEDAPVPVTARKLEALVRLAEASARVRLSDDIEVEDAERAVRIARHCLEDIGMDPETGEYDADMIETGTSKSQRDRIKDLLSLIADIEAEYDEGAPVDVVIERAEEGGMEPSTAEHEIEQLKQKGEVYEPRTDHLRTT